MELELRHLRVLCAIADAGSVGRAAVLLGASQPATSTQLRRIERHLGAPLFERTATGVAPTCFGVEVLAAARDLLTRADGLGRRPEEETGRPAREVRVAATNSPILPGLVTRARHQQPDLRFAVSTVYRSDDLIDLLERDDADAVLAVDYPGRELHHSPAVALRGIVTEPGFVALPAHHHLRHRTEVSLADLAEEAWFLSPEDGAGWHAVFYGACAAAGFTPVTVHEFLGGRLELQEMIAAGLGVAVVQATTRPLGEVVVKPLAGTPIWIRHLLAWRATGVSGEVVETMYGAATAAYRELVGVSPQFRAWASRTYRATRP
ncbi:LysR family transcriptional regulator [Kitasatospora sp. NPDC002227]|uniref:LysR family transcriptional regulator n=1 Tax=Kitasatospora sp. NPDC002227 TaxID=3154773 RepID=UPI003328A808